MEGQPPVAAKKKFDCIMKLDHCVYCWQCAESCPKQAHCRYGPSTAYLHAADLYSGDVGTVRGRFQYSRWLYIKFDKLNYFCWVAPSVVDAEGDVSMIYMTDVRLPGPSVLYGPPAGEWKVS